MEKYGVHKDDSIEKKAKKLVKTGSAENIDDARQRAVELDLCGEPSGKYIKGSVNPYGDPI